MKRIIAIMLSLTLLVVSGCGMFSNREDSKATEDAVGLSGGNATDANFGSVASAVSDNYRNYYEIFVHSFYDTDGDGIGDLKGVYEKLDYIEDLGANGLWLMPIMPSTTYHKYDVTDYCNMDKEYGSLEDFELLISECHNRKINVIIDLVMNHTSSKHPWFTEAVAYIKGLAEDEDIDVSVCPYAAYYNFSKEKLDDTWYLIEGTDYYYEGGFWSEMPDLNLENEAVITEFEKIADFWIARGVDGFRMDAPLHFKENDTSFNAEVLNGLYSYCVTQKPGFYMVSEVWANGKTIADYYQSKTPSMFDFSMADAEGDFIKTARGTQNAQKFVNKLYQMETMYSEQYNEYINAPFITNHDMGRVANALASDERNIKFAGGLLLSCGGSPFVYYGEELGMKSKGKKDENKRLALVWSKEDATGICNDPADADKGIEQAFAAADEQLMDENSILNYYKKALHLRNAYPEIARGTLKVYDEYTDGHIAVSERVYGEESIIIIYNTEDAEANVDLQGLLKEGSKVVAAISVDNIEAALTENILTIPAKSIVYVK